MFLKLGLRTAVEFDQDWEVSIMTARFAFSRAFAFSRVAFSRVAMGGLLLASFGFLACAGNVTPPSENLADEFAGAPTWVLRGCGALEKPDTICGVGAMGGTRNIALARTTAVARARTAIARTLSTTVKAMIKDYQSTTTGGEKFRESSSDEQHVTDVSKQITDVALPGAEMRDMWVSQSRTVYALVVLDVEKFQASVNELKDLSADVRRAIDKRARDAFNELDRHARHR